MEKYFGIKYEFDKKHVRDSIEKLVNEKTANYICVADGVTLAMSRNHAGLCRVLENSALNVCDSGWVPLYLKWIYGIQRDQYTGSNLFQDIIGAKKYKMMFLGTSDEVLNPLRDKLSQLDESVRDMPFVSLPFVKVEDFDYQQIAGIINEKKPQLIWVSLGMPKQELFMYNLRPYIDSGVLIGVGAAFNFFSGLSGHKRAPVWMIKCKLEWLYRIFSEPKKQLNRCWLILRTTPGIIIREYQSKKKRNVM